MNVIVSFCIGIILIAISNDLSVAIRIEWVSILCDILGGVLIGVGCKLYIDSKKVEANNTEKILANLNELSNKVLTSNDLTDISNQLTNICSNNSEILTQISAKLVADEQYDNYIKNHMTEIEKSQKKQIEIFDKFGDLAGEIKKLSPEILDMLDECVDNINKQADDISSKLLDLTYDLESLEKKRNDSFRRIMNEIQDYNSECNDTLTDEIKKLSNQYTQFELLCKKMIDQMTQMSEKDYEIIKEMLNG